MVIFIHTQYCENYGTADQPYWKFKGGDTIVVEGVNLPLNDSIVTQAQAIVDAMTPRIAYRNDASEVYILDWEIVLDDNARTTDEQLQMEYDKEITYPSPRLKVAA